jgi:hypothetical protein
MDLTVKGLQLSEAILQEFGLGEAPYVNPQEVELQRLLAGATEPWEKEHYKWRINRLKDQTALAGEPGAGNGPPVDSKGNLIAVLPAREWIKKNPNTVKEMPNEALPPELRKPSMLDKIGGAISGAVDKGLDWVDNKSATGRARQDLEHSRRDQGLRESTDIDPRQDTQADGTSTYTDDELANIQDPNAAEWVAVRGQIADAKAKGINPAEIAKLQAQYDQLAGGKADAWEQTYAKVQAQKEKDQSTYTGKVQYVDPKSGSALSEDLDRIKSLTSRVLRG